jgi:hypothetical protein
MNEKILYVGCGSGIGQVYNGLAILKAAARRGLDTALVLDKLFTPLCVAYPGLKVNEVIYASGSCKQKEKYVASAILQFEPDYLVSGYNFTTYQNARATYAGLYELDTTLLWRNFALSKEEAALLDPARWSRVMGLDPHCFTAVEANFKAAGAAFKMQMSPKIFPVWEDELYDEKTAREYLYWVHRKSDTGKPLMAVVHNGIDHREMDQLLALAYQHYHEKFDVLGFSQNPAANGAIVNTPIALYLQGIDHLVAYADSNIRWEFARYGRAGATAAYYVYGRSGPRQVEAPTSADRQLNGADYIIDQILVQSLAEKQPQPAHS